MGELLCTGLVERGNKKFGAGRVLIKTLKFCCCYQSFLANQMHTCFLSLLPPQPSYRLSQFTLSLQRQSVIIKLLYYSYSVSAAHLASGFSTGQKIIAIHITFYLFISTFHQPPWASETWLLACANRLAAVQKLRGPRENIKLLVRTFLPHDKSLLPLAVKHGWSQNQQQCPKPHPALLFFAL